MSARRPGYIPAAGHDWLAPLYDPLQRVLMREAVIKRRLVAEAQLQDGQRVLDLGCGTGTLAILIKQLHPGITVVGLDADGRILEQARNKATRAGIHLDLERGMAFALPHADAVFDRVVSSLVLHHLTTENKQRALQEVWRVTRPAGAIAMVDFGPPTNGPTRVAALLLRHFEEVADNLRGLVPQMLRDAGFQAVAARARYSTVFGTVVVYTGSKPDGSVRGEP